MHSNDIPNTMGKTLNIFTFRLIDGSNATYSGFSEAMAFSNAQRVHGKAVQGYGIPAKACCCKTSSLQTRVEGDWIVCVDPDCAGIVKT